MPIKVSDVEAMTIGLHPERQVTEEHLTALVREYHSQSPPRTDDLATYMAVRLPSPWTTDDVHRWMKDGRYRPA